MTLLDLLLLTYQAVPKICFVYVFVNWLKSSIYDWKGTWHAFSAHSGAHVAI